MRQWRLAPAPHNMLSHLGRLCSPSFKPRIFPHRPICVDVNECLITCNTEGTKCTNLPDGKGYMCECIENYQLVEGVKDTCVPVQRR